MTTDRPTPTPAELLAAARALLAQAEAMMREPAEAAPTPSTPEPDDATVWRGWVAPTTFTPWPDSVAVGVDHGNGPDAMASVLARYHTDPPTWTTTPAASPEPKPEPLRWRKDEDGYWRLHDGDRPTFYWSTPLRAYVSQAVSVPAYSLAESVAIVASAAMEKGHKVEIWSGEPKPEPKPAGVLLTGWRMFGRDGWELWDTAGLVHAAVGTHGWACRDISTTGPETGLRGKEEAVERLIAEGSRWESPVAERASHNHDTRALSRLCSGDLAVMTDGSRRTVEETTRTRILFADGTWMSLDAAETAIAARIPAAST